MRPMGATYLDGILAAHRERVARDDRAWAERLATLAPHPPRFASDLAAGPRIAVIAEVKRRSPSKGDLAPNLDAVAIARDYERGGARAISVLTDRDFFGGSLEDLASVRAAVDVPLLRKDFLLSPNDLIDAREAGADAVLLIVAALGDEELAPLIALAGRIGLDALVEVHTLDEIHRALDAGARCIGINQRDLHSFAVDTDHAGELRRHLPDDVVSVAESGLRDAADVRRAADLGFDAVLVGEAFVVARDRRGAVASFAAVERGGQPC